MLRSSDMDELRVLCDVVKHHSFSQAAALHGITQSAASQRVGQLEKRLGVTLIDRSVRPLKPTLAGEVFLEGCQDLIERYDRLTQRVTLFRSELRGVIRVDAIYSAGIDLLNQIKEAYEPLYPQVEIVIEYKHPDEVYEAVRGRRCDLGIVSYPRRWRDVEVVPLRDEPMAVVCCPDHPSLANRQSVYAAELSGCSMVSFEPHLPAGRHIKQYLKEHDAAVKIDSVFDNVDTIKGAVAVTHHVAILPKRTARREESAGTLVVLELQPPLTRPLGVIHRKGSSQASQGLAPLIQSFVDFLLKHAGPNGDLVEASAMVPA